MPGHTLILWNDLSQKWQDVYNDFFCSKAFDDGDGWAVRARYGFPDGTRLRLFDTEQEAMAFFVNFLFSRHQERATNG